MDRRPKFTYGIVPTDWEATVSSPSWLPGDNTVGGEDVSSAGIPVSYEVRRDYLVFIRLRFWESEWAAVHALVAAGQGKQILTWYPDADEPTSFAVYLDSPMMGEPIQPSRDSTFPRLLELNVTLRNATATAPWAEYFADASLS